MISDNLLTFNVNKQYLNYNKNRLFILSSTNYIQNLVLKIKKIYQNLQENKEKVVFNSHLNNYHYNLYEYNSVLNEYYNKLIEYLKLICDKYNEEYDKENMIFYYNYTESKIINYQKEIKYLIDNIKTLTQIYFINIYHTVKLTYPNIYCLDIYNLTLYYFQVDNILNNIYYIFDTILKPIHFDIKSFPIINSLDYYRGILLKILKNKYLYSSTLNDKISKANLNEQTKLYIDNILL